MRLGQRRPLIPRRRSAGRRIPSCPLTRPSPESLCQLPKRLALGTPGSPWGWSCHPCRDQERGHVQKRPRALGKGGAEWSALRTAQTPCPPCAQGGSPAKCLPARHGGLAPSRLSPARLWTACPTGFCAARRVLALVPHNLPPHRALEKLTAAGRQDTALDEPAGKFWHTFGENVSASGENGLFF